MEKLASLRDDQELKSLNLDFSSKERMELEFEDTANDILIASQKITEGVGWGFFYEEGNYDQLFINSDDDQFLRFTIEIESKAIADFIRAYTPEINNFPFSLNNYNSSDENVMITRYYIGNCSEADASTFMKHIENKMVLNQYINMTPLRLATVTGGEVSVFRSLFSNSVLTVEYFCMYGKYQFVISVFYVPKSDYNVFDYLKENKSDYDILNEFTSDIPLDVIGALNICNLGFFRSEGNLIKATGNGSVWDLMYLTAVANCYPQEEDKIRNYLDKFHNHDDVDIRSRVAELVLIFEYVDIYDKIRLLGVNEITKKFIKDNYNLDI
jgi:hypothetical protein